MFARSHWHTPCAANLNARAAAVNVLPVVQGSDSESESTRSTLPVTTLPVTLAADSEFKSESTTSLSKIHHPGRSGVASTQAGPASQRSPRPGKAVKPSSESVPSNGPRRGPQAARVVSGPRGASVRPGAGHGKALARAQPECQWFSVCPPAPARPGPHWHRCPASTLAEIVSATGYAAKAAETGGNGVATAGDV
jgi:hypothetical protein